MSRHPLLIVLAAAAPAVTACASAAPAPLMLARVETAVPPMPAELLAPTNGKADAPVQLDTAFVLAMMQSRRVAPAARPAAEPAPLALARADEPQGRTVPARTAATPAQRLARVTTPAAAPSRPAPAAARLVLASAPIQARAAEPAPVTPTVPIRYADLASAGPAAPPEPSVGKAPAVRPAVRTLALAPLAPRTPRVRRAPATSARPAPAVTTLAAVAIARAVPAAPPRVHRPAAAPAGREPVIRRIRAVIAGWLTAMRA